MLEIGGGGGIDKRREPLLDKEACTSHFRNYCVLKIAKIWHFGKKATPTPQFVEHPFEVYVCVSACSHRDIMYNSPR